MKKNEALFKINNEKLYREKNLIVVQIPIFFICKDENEHRYLVLLLDFDADEYIICPILDDDLLMMLTGKIDMRQPFKTAKKIYRVKTGESLDKDNVKELQYIDLEDEILPEENALFEIGEDEGLRDYVFKLKESKYDFNRIKANAESIISTLAKDLIGYYDIASKYSDFAIKSISNVAEVLIECNKMFSPYATMAEHITAATEVLYEYENMLSVYANAAVENISTAVQALAEYDTLSIIGINNVSQLEDYKVSIETEDKNVSLKSAENKNTSFTFSYSSVDMETSYYHVDEYISIKVA